MISPYIADSIRRQRLEAEQRRALIAVLDDLVPATSAAWMEPPTVDERIATLRRWKKSDDKNYRNDAKRRARKAGTETSERISRSEIIARDKSTCHLCGKKCKRDKIHLDHVVPLAKGGTHTADNLRVAHAHCNMLKADLVLSELPGYTAKRNARQRKRTHART